jgi:hypothetical protein
MTKNQIIKALYNAGVDMSTVLNVTKSEVEIFVDCGSGRADEEKTQNAIEQVRKVLPWGGYYTGYGSLVMRENYESLGDWNDRCSKHHY